MPIIGIDLGTHEIRITAIINGKIKTLEDKFFNTAQKPFVVFKRGKRYCSHEAISQSRNDQSAFVRFSKKHFAHIFDDLNKTEFHKQITLNPSSKYPHKFEVRHGNEMFCIDMTHIAFMLFQHCLKVAANKFPDNSTFDCLVTIPGYFSMSQRDTLKRCAKAAGFNDAITVSDVVLAGLYHSFFNYEPPEGEEKYNVLMADFSYSGLQLSLCEIQKASIKEICYKHIDVNFRNFNTHLVDFIYNKFIEDHGHLPDIKKKEIYSFIDSRIDKYKETLMQGFDTKFTEEYQGNDIEVVIPCTAMNDQYEEINLNFRKFVDEFANSEIVKSRKIHYCLPCSSGTLVNAVSQYLLYSFDTRLYLKTPINLLVPNGAALCAGVCSSAIKTVQNVKILMSNIVPIEVNWINLEGKPANATIFDTDSHFPSTCAITFKTKKNSFDFTINYKTKHPYQANTSIATVHLKKLPLNSKSDKGILVMKANISLDISGLLTVNSITYETKREFTIQEEVTDDEEEIIEEIPQDIADQNCDELENEQPNDDVDNPKENEESNNNSKSNGNSQVNKKKKTKLVDKVIVRNVREDLKFDVVYEYVQVTEKDILESEQKLNEVDKRTAAAILAREDMYQISQRCSELLDNEHKQQFVPNLESIKEMSEDALSTSGLQHTKINLEKITELIKKYKTILEPIEKRILESDNRKQIVEDFQKTLDFCFDSLKRIIENREEYKHIIESEIEKLKRCLNYYKTWLKETLDSIEKSPKSQDAPQSNAQIIAAKNAMLEKAMPTINKPIPPREPKNAEDLQKDDKSDEKIEEEIDTQNNGNVQHPENEELI